MIGKKRIIDMKTVAELDNNFPETFVNRDPTKNRGLIAPRTPCPVLYGIRGKSPDILENAHKWLQSNKNVEKSSDYAVHCTNQLSDDHVTLSSGTVISKPLILVPSPNVVDDHQTKNAKAISEKGGCVLIKDSDAKNTMLKTAFDLFENKSKMDSMKKSLSKLSSPNATQKIVNKIYEII